MNRSMPGVGLLAASETQTSVGDPSIIVGRYAGKVASKRRDAEHVRSDELSIEKQGGRERILH
jgi:hypothetical protein